MAPSQPEASKILEYARRQRGRLDALSEAEAICAALCMRLPRARERAEALLLRARHAEAAGHSRARVDLLRTAIEQVFASEHLVRVLEVGARATRSALRACRPALLARLGRARLGFAPECSRPARS